MTWRNIGVFGNWTFTNNLVEVSTKIILVQENAFVKLIYKKLIIYMGLHKLKTKFWTRVPTCKNLNSEVVLFMFVNNDKML